MMKDIDIQHDFMALGSKKKISLLWERKSRPWMQGDRHHTKRKKKGATAPPTNRIRCGYTARAKALHEETVLRCVTSFTAPPKGMACSFVTLTYPGVKGWRPEFADPDLCAKHLEAWWKRVIRSYGHGCCATWTIELQKRGAWHFHLLVIWTDCNGYAPHSERWTDRMDWVKLSWAQVVGGTHGVDPDHLKAGCRIEPVQSFADIIKYLQKAGPKRSGLVIARSPISDEQIKVRQRSWKQMQTQGRLAPGQWWGKLNKKALQPLMSEWRDISSDWSDAMKLAASKEHTRQQEKRAEEGQYSWDFQPMKARGAMIVPIIEAAVRARHCIVDEWGCVVNPDTGEILP